MNNTPFYEYSNKHFIEKLGKLKDRNVLLLLLDGSAAFGRIGRIDDWVVTILPALNISELNFVQFHSTHPILVDHPILTSQLFIDSHDIAHVVEGPFILPPLSSTTIPNTSSDTNEQIAKVEASTPIPGRQYCKLAEELEELENKNAAIVTLGGWLIGGKTGKTDHALSLIKPGDALLPPLILPNTITIFGLAFPQGLRLSQNTAKVWSNLKTLAQIILP
jgi:hypothetical protein